MNAYEYSPFPGRPSKEEQALQDMLRRVNCNDRREPQDDEARQYALRTSRLAAVAYLSAAL
ncbi:hypothetical protein ACWEWD_36080 [Streptomyces tendae]